MWVCFLAFFDLRPSSLANRPFSVGPYLQTTHMASIEHHADYYNQTHYLCHTITHKVDIFLKSLYNMIVDFHFPDQLEQLSAIGEISSDLYRFVQCDIKKCAFDSLKLEQNPQNCD